MNKKIFFFGIFCAIFTSLHLATSAIAKPTEDRSSPSTQLVLGSNNMVVQNSQDKILNLNKANSQSSRELSKIIIFCGLIGTSTLLWWFFQSRQQGNESSFAPTVKDSPAQLLNRVSPKLRRQLLRLINDPKTVNRLLTGIHHKNPHRSPNWVAEKAIYDLRRGR